MRWFLRIALIGLVVGLAIPVATAHATTTVQEFPFEPGTDVICGETLTFSGRVVSITTEQALGNGGFLLSFHFRWQGVSAISSSGVPYRATGGTSVVSVFLPGGDLTTLAETIVVRFHFVGTMGAPTFDIRSMAHITFAPSGFAMSFDRFSQECG